MGVKTIVIDQDTKKVYHTSTCLPPPKNQYRVTQTEYFFIEKVQEQWVLLQKLLKEIVTRPTIKADTPNTHIWHDENGFLICQLCKEQHGQSEDECPGETYSVRHEVMQYFRITLGCDYGDTLTEMLEELDRLKEFEQAIIAKATNTSLASLPQAK